ncbi:MAG: flagellar M-ring protein FliF [Zoogloeaceae bacterium]|jgi:flagellar M-ring protein FliF|nr:flagellar M-ring protein FliF [Zoogloeaceae bacterium]
MAANPEMTAGLASGAAATPASPEAALPFAERVRAAFLRLSNQQRILLAAAVAAIIAVLLGAWLWGRQPDYAVLFSNLAEKDGGAVIAALEQGNVPYRIADNGAAILVPQAQVHSLRMRLATQGLPRGGAVGFELMDTQKFGMSQFNEQVNYQRALEGELARTIQSIGVIESARVHLAIPKDSVFVRDKQKPTASVLVHLLPGRMLDPAQVSGISYLVSSSVPQMPLANVHIVDQNGEALSPLKDKFAESQLDAAQLAYVKEVEGSVVRRIDDILARVMGKANFSVQVAADLDFSHTEQTAEIYTPNGDPQQASVRSRQVSESADINQKSGSGGIPGALTNQPPVPATAPLSQPNVGGGQGGMMMPNPLPTDPKDRGKIDVAGVDSPMHPVTPPLSSHRETTTNYEVDKTVRYTRQSLGVIRRLTAAVVVNYRMVPDKSGKDVPTPLSEEEIKNITGLVRDAMGYNAARGDSVSVVSAQFAPPEAEEASMAIWKQPETVAAGISIARYLVLAGILFAIYFIILRPLLRVMFPPATPAEEGAGAGSVVGAGGKAGEETVDQFASLEPGASFEVKLQKARELARNDPQIVVNVIKEWLGTNG